MGPLEQSHSDRYRALQSKYEGRTIVGHAIHGIPADFHAQEIRRIWAYLDTLAEPDIAIPISTPDNRDQALRVAVEALQEAKRKSHDVGWQVANRALESLKSMGVKV